MTVEILGCTTGQTMAGYLDEAPHEVGELGACFHENRPRLHPCQVVLCFFAAMLDRVEQLRIKPRDTGEGFAVPPVGLVVGIVYHSQLAGVTDEYGMPQFLQQMTRPPGVRPEFKCDEHRLALREGANKRGGRGAQNRILSTSSPLSSSTTT